MARPNADKQNAPNKEMKSPNRGTDTANTTENEHICKLQEYDIQRFNLHVTKTSAVLTTYSHNNFLAFFSNLGNKYMFHVMSMAT